MGQRWEGYIGVRKDRSVWKMDQGKDGLSQEVRRNESELGRIYRS